MYMEITTTITSKIPLTDDGLGSPEHSVEIDGQQAGELPEEMIYAVVLGGLNSARDAVLEASPRLAKMEARS